MSDSNKVCRGTSLRVLFLVVACAMGSVPGTAQSESDGAIERLEAEITKRDALIDKLVKRLDEVERRLEQIEVGDQPAVTPLVEVVRLADSTVIVAQSPPEPAAPILNELAADEQNRLVRDAFERTLIDRGGLLLPPRTFNAEGMYSYVHSSADNVVIDGFTIFPILVIGDIVSERVDRDLNLGAMTLRFGLPWDSQLEARVPFGHEKLRVFSADGDETRFTDSGVGDVSIALSHQIFRGDGTWPDVLMSAGIKFDTGADPFKADEREIFVGSGYLSGNLSLTGVKVVDPLVFFAGLSYTYNASTKKKFETQDGDPVRLRFEPGNSWGFNLGMAIALNINSSLSFTYDQQFTKKSRLGGESIPGSYATTGVFSIGSTYSFTDRLTTDFKVGIGVTEDSPDVIFSVAVPLRGRF